MGWSQNRVDTCRYGEMPSPAIRASCEHVFVRTYSYTLTEHNPDKPWLIVRVRTQMKVELEEGRNFFEWAREHWPANLYTVELDPYQL